MSSEESEYYSPDELEGFVVSEPSDNEAEAQESDHEAPRDRIREMTSMLKPNENFTQKILKAHISVLVSALGGPDYSSNVSPPPYRLGHDALACIKDIKRWIKSVDERGKSYDVALACAESGLVTNDLVVMLCQWDTQISKKKLVKNARTMEKIMLAALELLVLLTWPTELTPESSESEKLSFSNLRKSQIVYKKHILLYNKGQTLKAVIRLVLDTLAKEKLDREPRDNAVLRLVLFFIRNLLYISPISSSVSSKSSKELSGFDTMPANVSAEDISMNAVLSCFKRNKVLMFLLTMSNSVGSDFDKDVFGGACLECIHLIIQNVPVEHVISPLQAKELPEPQQSTSGPSGIGSHLSDLLKEEKNRKRAQSKHLSTRHGRFGSLLSIQGEEQTYVISGQEALHDVNLSLDKLDKSKSWNKPKSFKYDSDEYFKGEKVYLNTSALVVLREFINQFLAGDCFNNLISNVGSVLSSQDDLTMVHPYERAVYFLTVAWFLRYKRERNVFLKNNPKELEKLTEDDDPADFSTVKAGLSQTNFILTLTYFRTSFVSKQWSSVHVAMVEFLDLLLLAHTLFISKPKEIPEDAEELQEELDKELGEGIVRNLFTSQEFLNMLVLVPQTASKHSPNYLKTSIHIVHILLKSFEAFTKENIKLYIQKRRRKAKSKNTHNDMEAKLSYRLGDVMDESDEEIDQERAKSEKVERELDLARTEVRFFHTSTVSTYIDYLSEYEDLSHEEVKRCLSFFHRLFVVKKDHTALFRLDFMFIIHKLRDYYPRSSSIRNHVDEFIVYFMKKFKVAFARFPNPVEILFPRFETQEFKSFLATGELLHKYESSNQPKLAKEVDFIREFSFDEKIKILVTALYSQEKESFLSWIISALDTIIKQRLLDVADGTLENPKPVTLQAPDKFRRLLINNPYIRHLLSLVKFDLPDILEENCELPGSVTSAKLVEFLELIKKYITEQPITFEDGKDAFYFLTSKDTYNDYEYEDINYSGYDPEDTSIAFETRPSANKSHYLEELDRLDALEASISSSGLIGVAKKKNKRVEKSQSKPKKKLSNREPIPRGPRQRHYEPERPTKSAEFIHDSDDDSDEERDERFYAREEKLRRLLQESGGIVNSAQLEEFKKVWLTLANDTNTDLDSSVHKAVATATRELHASQHEESQDMFDSQSQFTQSQKSQSLTESQADSLEANDSTQLLYPENESEGENSSESDTDNDSDNQSEQTLTPSNNKENEPESEPVSRKRKVLFSDEESDAEDVSYVSASGDLSRKRRAVLDDDDDE